MTTKPTTALVKRATSLPIHATVVTELSPTEAEFPALRPQFAYLSASALKQHVHLVAGSGVGKSRWLGRIALWRTLIEGKGFLLIDPTGATVDNLLDKIVRLPLRMQHILFQRFRYVDDGNKKHLVPTLAYYRQDELETFFEIANRLPSVFIRQNPELAGAPILGENAMLECAIHAGEIAVALNKQLDFVIDLIRQPALYKQELREALAQHPELLHAVTYFREMMDPNSGALREKRTGSFKNKLLPFLADPLMLAKFAGTKKQLNWAKELQKRSVIIDLRHERDPRRRQFKMIWYLKTFMDYIKYRGMAGRGNEVLFVIDEISDMVGQRTAEGRSILAEDIEELISRLGRNMGVNVIVAHQYLSQLDKPMQNVLMEMGTQIIGHIENPDDLLRIARQFLGYEPYDLKELEPVWMTMQPNAYTQISQVLFGGPELPMPKIIDYHRNYFSPEEQLLLLINKLQALGQYQFMVKTARQEGDLRGSLKKITIARLDQGQYPNEEILAPLREQLAQRDGVPVETLLAEIRARSIKEIGQDVIEVKAPKKPARLKGSSSKPHDKPRSLPNTQQPVEPVPSAAGEKPGRDPDEQETIWHK